MYPIMTGISERQTWSIRGQRTRTITAGFIRVICVDGSARLATGRRRSGRQMCIVPGRARRHSARLDFMRQTGTQSMRSM